MNANRLGCVTLATPGGRMTADYFVLQGDVVQTPSDLLLLKYAQKFHGADEGVAKILVAARCCKKAGIRPLPGDFALVGSRGAVFPKQIMFMGTPVLHEFTYDEMYLFARRAVLSVHRLEMDVHDITTTVHGVNCGRDGNIALEYLVRGFRDELARTELSPINSITFLTLDSNEAKTLNSTLASIQREEE